MLVVHISSHYNNNLIQYLYLGGNSISTIDVSNLSDLYSFQIWDNQLSSIDGLLYLAHSTLIPFLRDFVKFLRFLQQARLLDTR